MSADAVRSYLYVPAHRDDLVRKALHSEADAIVIDLEDAVPSSSKGAARLAVQRTLGQPAPLPVWARVSTTGGRVCIDDLSAVAGPHLAGVRIAKAESVEQVREAAEWLAQAGTTVSVSCLIESALGLERIYDLARAHPAVCGIALGESDLAADLGTRSDAGLLYARSRCVAAARAAGLRPPVQSVYANVRDEAGLLRSTESGRDLGFFGRSAIHPGQLPVINAVYTPSPESVREARSLVEQLKQASDRGVAAFTLPDGRFVDPAVVESARRTLALSERLGIGQ